MPPDQPPKSPKRSVAKVAGAVIGLTLLAGAVLLVWRSSEDFGRAWSALPLQPPRVIAVLLALPILNCLTTAAVFAVLTDRFGRVGRAEMFALIGAGWLLNYLPFGSGLVGRIAYHRLYNGVRVRDSARVAIESIVIGLAVAATGGGAWWLTRSMSSPAPVPWIAGSLALAGLVGLAALVAPGPERRSLARAYVQATVFKCVDMGLWTLRYILLFRIMGVELSPGSALGFATLSQLATMIPFLGNGLGAREWLIGLAASLLPAGVGVSLVGGLSIELLNRVMELAGALAVGVPCTVWLVHRVRTRSARAA